MSYTTDSYGRFLPVHTQDLKPTQIIAAGEDPDTSPYRTGLRTLMLNHMTNWAHLGHPVILDGHHAALEVLNGSEGEYPRPIAVYKFPIPGWLPGDDSSKRRYLLVQMSGAANNDTDTWTFTATTDDGSGTSDVGAWDLCTLSAIVPISRGPTEEYDVSLEVTVNNGYQDTEFYFQGVSAWILEEDRTEIDPFGYDGDDSGFSPVGEEQASPDMPLSVETVRKYVRVNDLFYRWNLRQVINFCAIQEFSDFWSAATPGPEVGLTCGSISSTGKVAFHEWVYFPRPGVRVLTVHLDALVPDWTDSGDNVAGFIGFDPLHQLTFTVNKASAFTSSTWLCSGRIPVPDGHGGGPLIIRLGTLTSSENKRFVVAGLNVHEFPSGE